MAAASRALMYPYDISLLHMIMHKFPDFEIIEVASPNGWGYVGKDAGSSIKQFSEQLINTLVGYDNYPTL